MGLDLLRGSAERANALRAGAILIGGASTRMGTDKSSLILDGQTLLERTIAAISPLVGEILIVGKPSPSTVGNVGGASRSLEFAAQTASLTIRRVADRWPGEGPLGGILSAFASTTALELLVVAVDLPWLCVDSLRALCATPMTVTNEAPKSPEMPGKASSKGGKQNLEERPADCVMTLHQSQLQPLHARYSRRCESLMGAKFAAGERSIVRCNLLVGEHVAEANDRSSVDVDTPEEWKLATNS
jgi:molybdopterin-guanine dinucleotide biosynthesis protein A